MFSLKVICWHRIDQHCLFVEDQHEFECVQKQTQSVEMENSCHGYVLLTTLADI